jgi:molybdopterin-containing oxidoreductase family iron-sulfur binding subunit
MSEIKRRDFLKVLGLTGAGTGLVGCAQEPAKKLIPYLVQPEEIVPGVPTWYASACRECPAGCGVHVKVREGRPIKVEGNPDHPVNAGRLCARGQAALQGLYNPDRITSPMRRVAGTSEFEPIDWDEAESILAGMLRTMRSEGRSDWLYLITDGAAGTLDRLFDRWMGAVGSPNRLIHESFDVEPLREANRLTFGVAEIPRYEIDGAELVVSFGAGFLETWISPVQYARGFSASQTFRDGRAGRFIHIGPRLSLTGSNADEWVAASPTGAMLIALAMARVLVAEGRAGARGAAVRPLVEPFTPERVAEAARLEPQRIERLAHEFADAPSSIALPPGIEGTDRNATAAHVAVNLLNYAAGNVGRTVRFGPNLVRRRAARVARLQEMVETMRGGGVQMLLVHGTDPVHTTPPALGFAEALASIDMVVSFSSYMDETAARAIFDTKSTGDLLLSLTTRLGGDVAGSFDWPDYPAYLRDAWQDVQREFAPGSDFEEFWHSALSNGGVWRRPATQPVTLSAAVAGVNFDEPTLDGDASMPYTLLAYPSPVLYDGRTRSSPTPSPRSSGTRGSRCTPPSPSVWA